MAAEVIGLSVGGLSLVTAFRGTVDSFLLIKSFFDNEDDSGIHDLALHYHIQCQAFQNWGDRYNIQATNPDDCELIYESDHVKKLIAGIIERLHKLHEDGKKYLEIHDADLVLQDDAIASSTKFMKRLDIGSREVIASSSQRAHKKFKSRIKWAISNKVSEKFVCHIVALNLSSIPDWTNSTDAAQTKFAEVVKQMKEYNEGLDDLLSKRNRHSLGVTLPGRVLAPLETPAELEIVRRLMDESSFLVSHTARLKALKIFSDQNQSSGHTGMLSSEFIFDGKLAEQDSNDSMTAHSCDIGWHTSGKRVWVEWRVLNEGVSDIQTTMMVNRVHALGEMLSNGSTSILKTSHCIGVIQDRSNSLRHGLMFQPPKQHNSTLPITLLQIITESTKPSASKSSGWMSEPPLGHKFTLARNLASSLILLHASKWLHKAFRSDNILFFGDVNNHDLILNHYIAGFEHSRGLEGESYGDRPTGSGPVDYFYHPDVSNGFSKTMDLYSFGVVLLEIAFWRPLRSRIPSGKLGSLQEIRKVLLESARRILPRSMGNIYASVVVRCLECDFPVEDDSFATAMNVFIISQLDRCLA